MAAGMSAPELTSLTRAASGGLPAQSYGTISIVGGGCYGSYYLRQLHRARRAGAIAWERLVVVDHGVDCQVAVALRAGSEDRCDVATAEWDDYFDAALGEAAAGDVRPDGARDAIV